MACVDQGSAGGDWRVVHPRWRWTMAVGLGMLLGVGSLGVLSDVTRPVEAQPPSVQEQLLQVTMTQAAQLDVIKIQLSTVVERLETLHHDLEGLQAGHRPPRKGGRAR